MASSRSVRARCPAAQLAVKSAPRAQLADWPTSGQVSLPDGDLIMQDELRASAELAACVAARASASRCSAGRPDAQVSVEPSSSGVTGLPGAPDWLTGESRFLRSPKQLALGRFGPATSSLVESS